LGGLLYIYYRILREIYHSWSAPPPSSYHGCQLKTEWHSRITYWTQTFDSWSLYLQDSMRELPKFNSRKSLTIMPDHWQMNTSVPSKLDIDLMFACPGVLLSQGSQRYFTKVIRSLRPRPHRKSTYTNLDRIRSLVEEISQYTPTDQMIWTSIHSATQQLMNSTPIFSPIVLSIYFPV
jgi:hypothetical protein